MTWDLSAVRIIWFPGGSERRLTTASALASRVCGTVMPSILAVWLLMTSSTLGGSLSLLSLGDFPSRHKELSFIRRRTIENELGRHGVEHHAPPLVIKSAGKAYALTQTHGSKMTGC
jgi:hypothetical protein